MERLPCCRAAAIGVGSGVEYVIRFGKAGVNGQHISSIDFSDP